MTWRSTAPVPISLALCLAGCAATTAASTDVVATYNTKIGSRVMEADADEWLRSEDRLTRANGPPETYSLTSPDGRNYTIFLHSGKWVVAASEDYHAWQTRGGPPQRPSDPPRGEFVATGEERIGAWTGTGYEMKSGCGSWTHIVVMRGAAFDAFGRALKRNLLAATKAREPLPPCELQAIDLLGSGLPLLVDDPQAKLEKLEFRKIPPSRFELPAPPLSRAELFKLLGPDLPTTPTAPVNPRPIQP